MVVMHGVAKIGLDIEVAAVRIPDQLFVDLTSSNPTFAGVERTLGRGAIMPPDNASPADVMRAYIAAIKAGDEKVWVALYADWTAIGGEGLPLYRPYSPYERYEREFTTARNLLLHKFVHAEPVWESDPRLVVAGNEFPGAARIEEVTVMVDHIARYDDGDFVTANLDVHRTWELQRRDGGPWRLYPHNAL
jgi:hypothetical protein